MELEQNKVVKKKKKKKDQETALEHSKAAISENTIERETINGTEYSEQNDQLEEVKPNLLESQLCFSS